MFKQVIVDVKNSKPYGVELLVGHPKHTFQLAKRAGVLLGIDKYILQVGERLSQGQRTFVNVTPEYLSQDTLPFHLDMSLHNLVLEVTERGRMDVCLVARQIEKFRANGMKIALDDFGTGYNSLERWHLLKPDYVKIRWDETAYLQSVIRLARDMGAYVIVEKIETEQQHNMIQEMGVDFAQGFWYGRPVEMEREVQKI